MTDDLQFPVLCRLIVNINYFLCSTSRTSFFYDTRTAIVCNRKAGSRIRDDTARRPTACHFLTTTMLVVRRGKYITGVGKGVCNRENNLINVESQH